MPLFLHFIRAAALRPAKEVTYCLRKSESFLRLLGVDGKGGSTAIVDQAG